MNRQGKKGRNPVSWLMDKVRKTITCFHEHGLWYTLECVGRKIQLSGPVGAACGVAVRWFFRRPTVSFIALGWRYIWFISRGFASYRRLMKDPDFAQAERIYFMSYPGTGDTYLSCCYLQMQGVLEGAAFWGAGISSRIAKSFAFSTVKSISSKKGAAIHRLQCFLQPMGTLPLLPLVYSSKIDGYTSCAVAVEGLHGLHFYDLLRIWLEDVTGIQARQKEPLSPVPFRYSRDVFFRFVSKTGLPKGKTVILAPYANSGNTFGIPKRFWEELTEKLTRRGYAVCVNTSCKKGEGSVKGAQAVFLPLEMMSDFCAYAGNLISVRSGLCDITAAAPVNHRIVLYPPYGHGTGKFSHKAFFSLQGMELCKNCYEVEFSLDYLFELLQAILTLMDAVSPFCE